MEVGQKVKYTFYPDEDQTKDLEVVEAEVTLVHENGTTVNLVFDEKTVTGVNPGTTGNTYQVDTEKVED